MKQVAAHLWTGSPPPAAYVRLVLCRDVYHCTPVALEQVPLPVILQDLACLEVEAQVYKAKARRRGHG